MLRAAGQGKVERAPEKVARGGLVGRVRVVRGERPDVGARDEKNVGDTQAEIPAQAAQLLGGAGGAQHLARAEVAAAFEQSDVHALEAEVADEFQRAAVREKGEGEVGAGQADVRDGRS